jgi:hypothetical protein
MSTASQQRSGSRGDRLTALVAFVAVASVAPNATAAQPPRCQIRKLAAAAAEVRALLRCSPMQSAARSRHYFGS